MTCHYCGRAENFPAAVKSERVELRPYGPGGAMVCFECATATPEREKQTERAFGTLLQGNEAVSPVGIAAITDTGLIPFDPKMVEDRLGTCGKQNCLHRPHKLGECKFDDAWAGE